MKRISIVLCVFVLIITGVLSGCNEQKTVKTNENITTPTITSFTVNPKTINRGETAQLSWNVSNATYVSIDNAIGGVALVGSQIISPIVTTVYILTALNSGKQTTATTQIVVINHDLQTLVGTWKFQSGHTIWNLAKLVLYSDGTGKIDYGTSSTFISNYSINGSVLTIHHGAPYETLRYELQNENTLMLTPFVEGVGDSSPATYVRE